MDPKEESKISEHDAGRLYTGMQDLPGMIELLRALRPAPWLSDFPSAADLREVLALPRVQENTRLWFDDREQMVAFAFVDTFHNLRFEIDRQRADAAVEAALVDWGLICLRRIMREKEGVLTLDASCRDEDVERVALLERNGFERQERYSLFMERALHEPFPRPDLPHGFQLRPVLGEQEAAEIVALHRLAFGTEYMTVESRLNAMRTPGYDPDLDLVVIAPDGRIAAYALFTLIQEENERDDRSEGHADVGATHPDFQRQGLGRALFLTGMELL
ncbi:MAG: hypothetical protein R3293_27880, partial [Candidatus Promineifilaceae bacterium]|nr:hypothetical protein [Candidatus Promineifilaceae bacterium]